MPSKFCSAVAPSAAPLPATGWVLGRWSAASPQGRRVWASVTQTSVNSVASAVTRAPMYSAKDSLSHRSSHHTGVTRSPNHMCAISCTIVLARTTCCVRSTRLWKIIGSRNVTQPALSIAPALNSGTKAWW